MWNKVSTGLKIFTVTLLFYIFIVHDYHPLSYYVKDSYASNEQKIQGILNGHYVEQTNVEHKNLTLTTQSLVPMESKFIPNASKAILHKAVCTEYGPANGSFCDNFLHRTSEKFLPICAANNYSMWNSTINCYSPANSIRTIECAVNNILIYPKSLLFAVSSKNYAVYPVARLLVSKSVKCDNVKGFRWRLPKTKFVDQVVSRAAQSLTYYTPNVCKRWINDTVILFKGVNNHIYFEFLLWYGVFRSIVIHNLQESVQVIRCKKEKFTYNPAFAEFEKLLYPNILFMENLHEESVCFKKLIIQPDHFDSLLYRCKIDRSISEQCYQCNGKNRSGTIIDMYRSHVLKTCSVDDTVQASGYRSPQKIMYLRRKKYHRRPHDSDRKFERIVLNDDEMLTKLNTSFQANVTFFYAEDYSVCEQIKLIHDADILIGMHGAGLVHVWWLQKNALLFEILTEDKANNEAFKMISSLAGVSYKGYYLKENGKLEITLNVTDLINHLSDAIQNDILQRL